MLSVRSSSLGVLLMIGTSRVSRYDRVGPLPPIRTPLIILREISKGGQREITLYLLQTTSGLNLPAGFSSAHLMRDPKHHIFLPKQRRHHRILRMSVYTRASVSERKCIPEERCAGRFFEVQFGATEEDPIGVWRRFCLGIWQDEYVRRLDTFFLYT
jgi:hypothetical protein